MASSSKSFQEWEWELEKHPAAAHAQAEEILSALDPEKEPSSWISALWAYENSSAKQDKFLGQKLDNAIQLAKRFALHEEEVYLLVLKAGIKKNLAVPTPETESLLKEALILCDSSNLKRLKIRTLFDYAYYLNDGGQLAKSAEMVRQAQDEMKKTESLTPLDQAIIRNYIAEFMDIDGHRDQALKLYQKNMEFSLENDLKAFYALTAYNLGTHYDDFEDAQSLEKAMAFYEKSIETAKLIKHDLLLASSMLGLSTVYELSDRKPDAISMALQAAKLFERFGDKIWEADSYKRAGKAQIAIGHYAGGLASLETARQIFPLDYEGDLIEIERMKSQAYKGLRSWEAAFQALDRFASGYKELTEKKLKENHAKLKIDLGLQLEEEKNQLLEKQNDLQREKLHSTDRMRLVMTCLFALACVTIGLMVLSLFRSREIKESRTRMKRILDQIDEGILTIDQHLNIEPGYSRFLNLLFPGEGRLEGRDAIELILSNTTLSLEEQSIVRETLKSCLGEDMIAWEINGHHLPREVVFQGEPMRNLALFWLPTQNVDGKIQAFLLSVRDITERKALEVLISKEQKRSRHQQELMGELLQADTRRAGPFLQTVLEFYQRRKPAHQLGDPDILMHLHSIKGAARTLHMNKLSQLTHELEGLIQLNQNSEESLKQIWFDYGELLDLYDSLIQQFSAHKQQGVGHSTLTDLIAPHLNSFCNLLAKAGIPVVQIDLVDSAMPWPHDVLVDVSEMLLHGVTNSADHGFVLPAGRGQAVAGASLKIETRREGDSLEISLKDNGVGIDREKLHALAAKQGLSLKSEDDDLAVLFRPGFSTAEALTVVSGRGIGLAAIQNLCQKWKGQAKLIPRADQTGTELLISIPLSNTTQLECQSCA